MADDPTRQISADEAAAIAAEHFNDPELEERLRELNPEQIKLFVLALRAAMRKRRILLVGYLTALLCIVLGLAFAVIVWANREPGTFIGWVFFVPFGLAGTTLWLFGKIAGRIQIKVGDISVGIGSAGGLLLTGILVGYLSSLRPTFGRVPPAARYVIMELGLLFFMAGVGMTAGAVTLCRGQNGGNGPLHVIAFPERNAPQITRLHL